MSAKNNSQETQQIDLIALVKLLWNKRWFIVKLGLIGLVLGLVVAFSMPKEYTTTVIVAPDANSSGSTGMGALASMAGINLNQNVSDIFLSPDLYPNIIESTPFITGLFDVKVSDSQKNIHTTLYNYILDYQKSPWWGAVVGFPIKVLSLFSSEKESIDTYESSTNENVLTSDELSVFQNIKSRLDLSVDSKSGMITLSSTMQSPEISAFIADTVTSYLQAYIIAYRTKKARNDLDFLERLYDEAQRDYYKAQQAYSQYIDENRNVISALYRNKEERLQNEMALAFGVYNQTAQQLQVAKVKVQDDTPVYTIIQPAIVPIIASSPKKKLIIISFVFLAGIFACGWVLVKGIYNKSV